MGVCMRVRMSNLCDAVVPFGGMVGWIAAADSKFSPATTALQCRGHERADGVE